MWGKGGEITLLTIATERNKKWTCFRVEEGGIVHAFGRK